MGNAPRRRWTGAAAALTLLAVLGAVACTDDGPGDGRALGDPAAREGKSAPPEWLFAVQSEGESTFDATTGRLSIPTGSVQAFTDRPNRTSRVFSPGAFATLFHQRGRNSFEKDPPNAVLTYWDGSNTPRTAVCEVSRGAGVENGRLWVGLKVLEPAGTTLPARMGRASLFVDDVALADDCDVSPADETNIEYFNEIEFSQDIYLQIQDTGAAFQVSLSCPLRVNPDFPPPTLGIQLFASNGSAMTTCNNGTINLAKDQMPELDFCRDAGTACSFQVVAQNTDNQAIYSFTEIMVPFSSGTDTYIPDLNPARVPICADNVEPCVLTGTCSPWNSNTGRLQWCESPGSCTPPTG